MIGAWTVMNAPRRLAMAIALAASVSLAHAEDPPPETALTLQVIDRADRSPVVGAVVWVRAVGGSDQTCEATTNDEGEAVLGEAVLPPTGAAGRYQVVIAAAGYAPRSCAPAPGQRTVVELYRADAIGGTVRDEQGRPIAGARVSSSVGMSWPQIAESPNAGLVIATTDAQGRWRADTLRTDMAPEGRFTMRVTHPDYAHAMLIATAREARAMASEQVLRRGYSISGTVLSPFGRPVRGAVVSCGGRVAAVTPLRLTTDAEGRFRSDPCFDRKAAGALVLLVQASGLAWALHEVKIADDEIPPQVIRLTRRRPLEGRAVDDAGRPMADVVVTAGSQFFGPILDWETRTDAEGRFVWYDAPTTGKLYYINVRSPDKMSISRCFVPPGKQEVTITLPQVVLRLGR